MKSRLSWKNVKKRKSVLIDWGLSYLLILLIPILFGLFNNYRSNQILKREIQEAHAIVLDNLKNSVDMTLGDLEYISCAIIGDDRFTSLINTSKTQNNLLYASYRLRGLFGAHRSSNDQISLLAYLPDCSHIVTVETANSLESLYGTLEDQMEVPITRAQWKEHLGAYHTQRYKVSPYLSYANFGRDSLVLQSSLKTSSQERNYANLFVSLPCQSLFALSADVPFLICDSAGAVLYRNGFSVNIALPLSFSQSEGTTNLQLDGKDYLCSYAASQRATWYYAVFTPMDVINSELAALSKTLMATTFLALILGILMMVWFVSRNYMPLSEILTATNAAGTEHHGNEYEAIHAAFSSLASENETIRSRLDMQKELLIEKYLLSLLVGRAERRPDGAIAQQVRQRLGGKSVGIVGIHFVDGAQGQHPLTQDKQRYFDVMSFAIDNVFSELAAGRFAFYRVLDGEYLIYLIGYEPDARQEEERALEEILQRLYSFFDCELSVPLTLVLSEQVGELEQLHAAYEEVLDVFDYMQSAGGNGIVRASEARTNKSSALSHQDSNARQLRQAIETGDAQTGCQAARELMEEILAESFLPEQAQMHLLFGVADQAAGVFLSAVPAGPDEEKMLREAVCKLQRCCDSVDLEAEILLFVRQLCCYVAKYSAERANGLADQIIAYIQKNLTDVNLNINSIAQAFSINPKTVSRHFRQATGVGVLDYINQVRVAQAMDLAAVQSMSVEKLAAMVGYTNAKTFRRAFAKFVGTTPGRFFKQAD